VKRALLTATAATLVWLVAAHSVPGRQAPGAEWSHPKKIATSSGIIATYPRGWNVSRKRGPSLVFSSFKLPGHWWSEERKTLPQGGVFIWLFVAGPPFDGFPERPSHFELRDDDRRFLSCGLGFDGWNVVFVENSATVQAFIGLGRGAPKSDAVELLDRLTIRHTSPSLAQL
jgi:hypothetical protein